jgi:hypothetical protein
VQYASTGFNVCQPHLALRAVPVEDFIKGELLALLLGRLRVLDGNLPRLGVAAPQVASTGKSKSLKPGYITFHGFKGSLTSYAGCPPRAGADKNLHQGRSLLFVQPNVKPEGGHCALKAGHRHSLFWTENWGFLSAFVKRELHCLVTKPGAFTRYRSTCTAPPPALVSMSTMRWRPSASSLPNSGRHRTTTCTASEPFDMLLVVCPFSGCGDLWFLFLFFLFA